MKDDSVAVQHTSPRAKVDEKVGAKADSLKRLTSRERFLHACECEPVDYPPIWLMRQAGRALPEYRTLKNKYSFLEMVRTPDLAVEVTLQPIRRFKFDAAIIFSDILVVPEAMGQGYHFRETGGVQMDFAIQSAVDIDKLSVEAIAERLQYVANAIQLAKSDLNGRTALLGFAGSPWTLANFMLDGGSASEHTGALALFREDRTLFERLCEKLTDAIITFLRMQIRAGVDAVQIFDSLGGIIPVNDFRAASGVWIKEIVAALGDEVPLIIFSKGTRDWPTLVNTGAQVIGVDHGISLTTARKALSSPGRKIGIQGNLDPACLILDTPETIRPKVQKLISEMRGHDGYIFNLGHGVPPDARLANIQAIVDCVRSQYAGDLMEPDRDVVCSLAEA